MKERLSEKARNILEASREHNVYLTNRRGAFRDAYKFWSIVDITGLNNMETEKLGKVALYLTFEQVRRSEEFQQEYIGKLAKKFTIPKDWLDHWETRYYDEYYWENIEVEDYGLSIEDEITQGSPFFIGHTVSKKRTYKTLRTSELTEISELLHGSAEKMKGGREKWKE